MNKCQLSKKIDIKNVKLPVNQWIYNQFVNTKSQATKHIENFRFDEATRVIYKFVWHYYCDWYLEFIKSTFISKNKSNIEEVRIFSSYMMSNILKLLHPFIPFFTETVWKKNKFDKFFNTPLINAPWPDIKMISQFSKKQKDIADIIEIISSIRSTKAELNIAPKLYCDIIYLKRSKLITRLIAQNIEIIKHIGRIDKLLEKKDLNDKTIEILVLKEKITLKFDTNIDVSSQKNKILDKLKTLEKKISNLHNKLLNKAYLKNAPRDIVAKDKLLLIDLNIEENKLRSIVTSIN